MSKQSYPETELSLDKIVGGGQALGTMPDGRKAFAWGGLPGERVILQTTKKKSSFVEGIVTEVLSPSKERVSPRDEVSYLSTSPWQIMSFDAEQHYKAALIEEAFELHNIVLPYQIKVTTDGKEFEYRNKVEFSFWWDKDREELDLAFFQRGSHGKVPVGGTSLAMPAINQVAVALRDVLRKRGDEAYHFKTVILRANQENEVVAQLYVKDEDYALLTEREIETLSIKGFELIFSNPKSPASIITKKLQCWGETILSDNIAGIPFTYAADSFFQVNIPVYELALREIRKWVTEDRPTVDLYSGVGSLGLTVTNGPLTLVEINETAVREANNTITAVNRNSPTQAIHSSSEEALEYITSDSTIIVDPPRAGLHTDVISKLLFEKPPRIIYLSCNPVTQARDLASLLSAYTVSYHQGYNFFPRTPHIEHLVVLDLYMKNT